MFVALLLPVAIMAQVVTTEPAFITSNYRGRIVVTFNPNEGNQGMVGATACYAHTGVITTASTSDTDWKYAPEWRGGEAKYKMTKVGSNWQLVIDDMYSYYECPTAETIEKLAFVFNDGPSGTKEGKTADGGDIFVQIYDEGLQIKFEQPDGSQLIESGSEVIFDAVASENANITLTINGETKKSVSANTELTYTQSFTTTGDYECVVTASNANETVSDTLTICVVAEAVSAARPAGLIDGINYDETDDTKVSLVMYAMDKNNVQADNVFVIGDFNNWSYSADYQMKKDATNPGYFWLTIDGLEPGVEYAFQYAVKIGGKLIKISDAYTEKVLDPWNDQYISEEVYPNLPTLPKAADGLASVIQTAQPEFEWSDATINFQRPDKNNLVIYELWVHDFSPARTIQAVINRLDYLQNLGINALELMPVTEFDGNISWGYNPNHYFAPDKCYGTPEAYKTLIDECHKRGIAVILDMVFNHASGINPFAKLYYGASGVAENNPWFNTKAPHDASVHQDFNHDFIGTQNYFKRVLKYWIEEYKIDGYRMDLTKGICGPNCNNRVALINGYYDAVKEADPNAYFILEHWTSNEEQGFVNNGMMCWGGGQGMNNSYSQLAMGWLKEGDGNISQCNKQGWVYFCESHDEERNQFKALQWGNGNVKSDETARLKRVPLVGAFNLLMKGPKMMWQFQELGYNFSITSGADGVYVEGEDHRVDPKPVPETLGWYKDAKRMNAYAKMAQLIRLRTELLSPEFFLNGTCRTMVNSGAAARYIQWEYNGERIVVVGNFNVEGGDEFTGAVSVDPFPATGKWYDYYDQTELNVTNLAQTITLQPGELRIYTTKKYTLPVLPPEYTYPDAIETPQYETECMVYPTYVTDYVNIRTEELIKRAMLMNLQGQIIMSVNGDVEQMDMSGLRSGMYLLIVNFEKAQQAYKLLKQ